MDVAMAKKSEQLGIRRFSLRSLLLWTTLVAFPLACFRQYYALVTDTVDGMTIPLLNAPGAAIASLGLGLLSIALICVSLAWQRKYASASILMATVLIGFTLSYPILNAFAVLPKQGNQIAELHNDAASLAAIAIKNYYARVGSWPGSWRDLEDDLLAASTTQYALPGSMGNPLHVNLASNLPIEELAKLVEVDFKASPAVLAKQSWSGFTGIRPHEPSYNFYRVQFEELIDLISAPPGVSEEDAKTEGK
jgi:hypothetical protein